MLDDRVPSLAVVTVEEPTGHVEEMDVCVPEYQPMPGYVLEPWVRVAVRDDWTLSAGVSVSRREDDGA